MATTVLEKLRITDTSQVYVPRDADAERIGVTRGRATEPEDADVAVLGIDDRAGLEQQATTVLSRLTAAVVVWITYPKGNVTDVNRDVIRTALAEHGWDTVAQVAVDERWSALRVEPVRG